MAITLRQIEAFRAVMISGTMLRAAELMDISQPAVSRLIADLEKTLGYPLFVRSHGRLQATEEARALFSEVRRSFVGLAQIEETGRNIGQVVSGTLRVMAMHALAMREGVDAITRFHRVEPQVRVELDVGPRHQVLDTVADRRCDLGIATMPIDTPGIDTEIVRQEEWVCLLPRNHALAGRETIHARDLAGEDFISFSRGSLGRTQVDQVFTEHGVARNTWIEVRAAESVYSLVARGMGVALIAPSYLPTALVDEVVIRPFTPTIPLTVALLTPAHQPMARRMERFLDHLRQSFAS